ncbi:hypothetical protein BH11ACT3_BH11ACT3_14200 [soil metagenome]
MDWIFNGLPLHILIVHFVVIVVPLAALCVVLTAAWPTARRRLGIVTPLVALAALISVPIATQAGEALEEQVNETALSELHTHLGKDLLPWAIALFAVAVLQWIWFRYFTGTGSLAGRITSHPLRLGITIALIVAAAVSVVGSSYYVFVIGESGARATWSNVGNAPSTGNGDNSGDSDSDSDSN